jgi:hypothetical protein
MQVTNVHKRHKNNKELVVIAVEAQKHKQLMKW